MKKIILTTLMIILILILVSNFSFATTVTVNDLKVAFNKIFKDDLNIKIEKENGLASTITCQNSEVKYIISDDSVNCEDDGYFVKVNYSLEDNKCILTSTTDITSYITELKKLHPEITEVEINLAKALISEANFSFIQECYLGVADAVDIDYSLAYTYLYQKLEQNSGKNNVTDSVFNYERTTLENNETSFKLELKLDELADLDSTKVNEFPKARVTLGKIQESKEDNNTNSNNIVDKNNVVNTNNTSNKNNNATGDSNTNGTTNTNVNSNINTNTNIASNTDINTTTNTNSSTNVQVKNEVDWSKLRNTLPKTGSDYPLKHTLISVIFIATALLVLVCMYNKKVGMTDETKR